MTLPPGKVVTFKCSVVLRAAMNGRDRQRVHCGDKTFPRRRPVPVLKKLLGFKLISESEGVHMKRWIISVLFSILLTYPAVSVLADDTSGSGSPSSSFGARHHSKKKKDDESADKKKEKELRDKKVDDAIKKAWEEK
jgi:hypothetical protein